MLRLPAPILLLSLGLVSAATYTPNYQACLPPHDNYTFCNTALSVDERVDALINLLTRAEKIAMISPNPKLGSTCNDHTSGVDRLGIPQWMWLTETNTGVNSACLAKDRCATTFSGPMGMAASFNRTSWRAKGSVMGTEMRALTNANWHRDAGVAAKAFIGVTGFGPNINQQRDPRFGRSSELPGEDPLVSGTYAAEMVLGMQEQDAAGHPKMLAYLKHFTAYSSENNRGHDTYNISAFDFWDSYLPQYELAFRLGNASGVMCSYDAENGRPSCANGWLLNDVLRGRFNKDAIVTTDCGVVNNMKGSPANAPDDEHAVAWTINNGTDIEMGTNIWTDSLDKTIDAGLTTEAVVTAALRRTQRQLFVAGRYDPPASIGWSSIGPEAVNASAHRAVQYEAALQSLVLLRNDAPPAARERGAAPLLPLAAGTKVAVLGPQGVTRQGLLSDYYGDDVCWTGLLCRGKACFDCIPTIAEGIARFNVGGSTTSAAGVGMTSTSTAGIGAALALGKEADVVVLALGNDKSVEHEGLDRTDTALPGIQSDFAKQVLALGKPTVLVLTNGGQIAFDELMAGPSAIIEAFNPSLAGAQALGATIFGTENRWGKLPYTLYPHDYIQQQPMDNYDMSKAPGRTYRYYNGKPLFPFGAGLSYTTFELTCAMSSGDADCSVTNTGAVDGDEVVMVFHSVSADIRQKASHPVPIKALVGFERVRVAAGASAQVHFQLGSSALQIVNAQGDKVLYKGEHTLSFSRGVGTDVDILVKV